MTDWRALFNLGEDFAHFRTHGLSDEIAAVDRVAAILSRPDSLSAKTRERIAQVNKPAYLLVCGEMWCPDCHRNITAFDALCKLAPAIQMRIITHSRGERALRPALGIERVAIPFAVVLDEQFNPVGTFVEYPASVVNGDETVRDHYKANGELEAAINDILDLILAK